MIYHLNANIELKTQHKIFNSVYIMNVVDERWTFFEIVLQAKSCCGNEFQIVLFETESK